MQAEGSAGVGKKATGSREKGGEEATNELQTVVPLNPNVDCELMQSTIALYLRTTDFIIRRVPYYIKSLVMTAYAEGQP